MKKIKLIGLTIVTVLWANSCKDFDELQTDPNRATVSHPSLLLTNLEINTFGSAIDAGTVLATRMVAYTQGAAVEQYYNWQRNGYGRYSQLRQVVKMNEEADRTELPNYRALGLFFQSVNIIELTKLFGDVPFTSSLSGESYTPTYDTQQSIYIKVLDDLKAANSGLSEENGVISGDVIYGGNITSWKKLINSLSLRILMSLSNKTGNTALNVKGRFNEILNDAATYPIMTSNADNGALKYVDVAGNRYPFFNNNSFKTDYYMESSFVELLKDRDDPRLFTMASQTPNAVTAGLAVDDEDSYGGLDGSAPLAENTNIVVSGDVSRLNVRYFSDPINEPAVLLSYAEVEFTLAEAAARGWTTDDAETHYLNGIHASLDFYGIDSGDQDQYVLQPDVVFNPAADIEQIITQKYINFFMNGDWESFYNHQRTGFPAFSVDGGGVLNNEQVPKRWMYPQDEFTLNPVNVEAAIDRQYPGGDGINEVMWLLKPE